MDVRHLKTTFGWRVLAISETLELLCFPDNMNGVFFDILEDPPPPPDFSLFLEEQNQEKQHRKIVFSPESDYR